MNQTGEQGIFNLTAPNPVTNKAFAQTLGNVLNRPSAIPVPGFVLKLIFGQMAQEVLLTGQRVIPHRLLESGFSFTYPHLSPALKGTASFYRD
jgi:NAD dependent epimerase/dehydratase family enzyme